MDKNTTEILQGLIGFIAIAAWVIKYRMHFNYRKAYDPALKNVDFGSFLTSFGTNSNTKLALCLPWISINRTEEAQVPGLAKKRQKIVYLCIAFVFIFAAVISLSNYYDAHFKTIEE